MKMISSFLLTLFASLSVWAQINPDTILFGLEATFQDQDIVNEPGRMTMETPHKKAQFEGMIKAFLENMKDPNAKVTPINSAHFKPGVQIQLSNGDIYIVDMEPVCIEWNQRPLKFSEIADRWKPVYSAASKVNLVPYVNPAAERSGMGHIHIGGATISESPFFQNPLLLRNMMVYYHQHPSLLWGFAEAFDIGNQSNIETFHSPFRQQAFESAVRGFDQWYAQASEKERVDGAFKFLGFLYQYGGSDFFHHYRFINLEHVQTLRNTSMEIVGTMPGKFTVEFRNIRPYRTPGHAKAMAELLLNVMTPLSEPNRIIPFRTISPEEYYRFHSGLVVEDDWRKVKEELHIGKNKYWENMIHEYANNLSHQKVSPLSLKGLTVAPTYSEKTNKGKYFEIVASGNRPEPELEIGHEKVNFQRVTNAKGEEHWVAVVTSNTVQGAEDLLYGKAISLSFKVPACSKVMYGTSN